MTQFAKIVLSIKRCIAQGNTKCSLYAACNGWLLHSLCDENSGLRTQHCNKSSEERRLALPIDEDDKDGTPMGTLQLLTCIELPKMHESDGFWKLGRTTGPGK